MAENDIEFSRKIIPPLIRTIINSNNLKMSVGEIEGDAVVFYRFGSLPTLNDLVTQCHEFYTKFNEQLFTLLEEYGDDFQKRISSNKLSLKVVVHAANIFSTQIEGITKLIGEDMVLVHKLLKNSVEAPEYLLLTDKLLDNYSTQEKDNAFSLYTVLNGMDDYDYIGKVFYKYIIFPPVSNSPKWRNPGFKNLVISLLEWKEPLI